MITRRSIAAGIALVLMMAAGAACSTAAPQLANRAFLSVAVTEGGVARALVPGTLIRLDFRAAELGATAGCNSIGGGYRVENGTLVVDAAGMTEMGCDEPRHQQDEWLVQFLRSRPALQLSGGELTLANGPIVVHFLDREIVKPNVALVGPTWTAISVISGDAVASIPQGLTATLRFHPDGTVDVDNGCNQGSGTWQGVGAGIQITALMLTKRACDARTGTLESAVMAVVDADHIAAAVDTTTLTLLAGGRGLQLRAT